MVEVIWRAQDNYLLEIRGDVREGLANSGEGESLESTRPSGSDKIYYVVRESIWPISRCLFLMLFADPQVDLSDLSSSVPS